MFAIIDNPASGKKSGDQLRMQVCDLLRERGEEVRLFLTQCEGDGSHQARLALDSGCRNIVCIGGDGTISEVVSQLAGSDATLYIVPHGTGNDFARAFGLPKDALQAFKLQLDGTPKQIDLGMINGKAFINVSGSGFDVEVLRKTEELKNQYPGEKAYRKALLSILSRYEPVEMEMTTDDGEPERLRSTIIEIANGRYFGGGMHVAPGARYDDGLFDIVWIKPVPRFAIPFLLPLFIAGVHVYLPIVRVTHAKKVCLRGHNMVVNIDGRLEEMDEAVYEILPKALRVMEIRS